MIFEVSESVINKRIAEALNISISEVAGMDKDKKKAKIKELFEDYVLDSTDTLKGEAFYKFY